PKADPERIAHFRVLGRLGQGGMGVGYRAEDEKLRRQVALKVLPEAMAKDEERRRRFLREARSAAAISHPNIATVYEVDEADGRVFIAMELVEGGTLRARVAKGALKVSDVVRIGRGIARGLARAHSRGVVHRDVKPDNVMLDEDGEPKILDFGLAKLREEAQPSGKSLLESAETESKITAEGRLLGTPGYMAPEQVRGKPVDARTDVFALGIVLYEMLCGEVPFRGESNMDVLMAIVRDAHRPLRERNPDVPEALAAVVDRCLAKSPDGRYATAREVAEALEAIAISADARVPSAPAALPSTRSLGASVVSEGGARPPRLVLVGVGLAALVVIAGALVWNARSSAPSAVPSSSATAGSLAPDGALAGIAITDTPPPKASNPEAAREYAQAMQALRDVSFGTARTHWARAIELDPGFAAAHLMLGCYFNNFDDGLREMSVAASLRSQLDERDAAILEVCQSTYEKQDFLTEAGWKRWKALSERFPRDALLAASAAVPAFYASDETTATAWAEHTRTLDPRSAIADWVVANYDNDMGRFDAAAAAADRCLARSPGALSCLEIRASVSQRLGQCGKLEEAARTMIARDPRAATAYWWLATALVARGAPVESVDEAMRRARELDPDAKGRPVQDFFGRLAVAQLTGDFATAIASFPGVDPQLQRETSTDVVGAAMYMETYVLMEAGQPDRALALAEAYAKRQPVLTQGDPLGGRQYALIVRRWTGHITDADFRLARDTLAKEAYPKIPPKFANNVWFDVYAEPAISPADARDALDALAEYTPLPPYEGNVPYERIMGKVLLLAGRVDEATAHL
ncbi:MAG TPA: protein kinase, partial [Polyangiaceae bacterium]|nr:protein kinase [Polyangiaceae bacterium]